METKENDVWFEVDQVDLRRSRVESEIASGKNVQIIDLFPSPPSADSSKNLGKYVAIDCEFVGVGFDGSNHALARVSMVNFYGEVLLDKYVRPKEKITDYRTSISGVLPRHINGAESFENVQREVAQLLENKVVIGHALKNDFKVLLLSHPRKLIRDTSKLRKFRALAHGKTPSLKRLAREFLGLTNFQVSEHDSVEDARVAMLLYRSFKNEWENFLFRQEGKTLKSSKREKERRLLISTRSFEQNPTITSATLVNPPKALNKMVLNII